MSFLTKNKFLILYYFVTFISFFFLINYYFVKDYIQVENYDNLKLLVKKAEINRGAYIINNKYSIDCEYILLNNKHLAKDYALWREYEFIPTICDVPAPFELVYSKFSDSIIIYKNDLKLYLLKPKNLFIKDVPK